MFPLSSHKLLRRRWLAGVLAIAVLLAQVSGLLHKLDFEAHPAGIACATCVAYSGFDAPLASTMATPLPQAAADTDYPIYLPAAIARTDLPVRARGPPSLA